jgi:hypothetical protein
MAEGCAEHGTSRVDKGGKMAFQTTANTPDERRWSFGARLTLALAIGYLLGGVLYTLAAFQQPSDGWNASNNVTTGWVTVLNQGGADVLHLGDRILAIEGVNVDMSDPPRHEPPPNWRIGATARYTIVRDGRTLDLDVPLVQIPAVMLPRFILLGVDGTSFAALLTLLSGVVIFLLRPGSVAARLLLLIVTYFVATAFIWLAMSTPALTFFHPLLYWAYRGTGVLWPLMFAMITHLILVFPLRTWPLTRWPHRSPGLLYGLTAAACIFSFLSFPFFAAALLINVLLMPCAVVGATIHNLRSTRDPVIRAQVGWVALGLAGSFVLAGLSSILGLIVPGIDDVGGYLPLLVLPICLGIAITRYRLFDIAIIIRRTLVYSLLSLTLGLVYFGCIVVLQQLVVPVTGGSELAIVASTLAIAALFLPLRRRIQNLIDRRFYRRKYDAARVLAAFGVTARDETDLEQLTAEVLRVVDATMQPEFIGLWLRETQPRAASDSPPP